VSVNSDSDKIRILRTLSFWYNLFAILMYSPVYPELIKLNVMLDNIPLTSIIYPSVVLERKTYEELCKRERYHFDMPIRESNIDLARVIANWLKQSDKYTIIVSGIQNETWFRNEHSVHGELIMYATQFESISSLDNAHKEKKKYEYPVNQFGTEEIKNTLIQIFSAVGETDFGKGIGTLRNEIAHVHKPKVLLNCLSLKELAHISVLLRITILGYVLNAIGIDKNVITKYQNKFISLIAKKSDLKSTHSK
jgi:hypothetical protein